MDTTDFFVKFNALDDAAKEVVVKMVELLSPGSRKGSKKNGKKDKQDQQAIDAKLEKSAELMANEYATDKELTAFSVLDGELIYEYEKK